MSSNGYVIMVPISATKQLRVQLKEIAVFDLFSVLKRLTVSTFHVLGLH